MSGGLSTELFKTAETHNPNRKMPTDRAYELIDEMAETGVSAVQFTGGGEPTLHAHWLEIIGHAQRLGLKTALVTNGIKLKPEHAVVRNLDWIRISVDAGTEATYCTVRRVTPLHWKKLWSNIALLKGFEGNFGAGFVVTNENFLEVGAAAKLCIEHGVPYLRVGAVFSDRGMDFYDDPGAVHRAIAEAKVHESENFRIVDLFGRRLSDLESGRPDYSFCGYQHFTTYIGADLNVYRCCNTAYTTKGLIGNAGDRKLSDLKREPFNAKSCTYCQFNGQNRAINAMLDEPEDVAFV